MKVALVAIFAGLNLFGAKESVARHRAIGPTTEPDRMLVETSLGLVGHYGLGASISGTMLFRAAERHPIYLGFETGFDFLPTYRYSWLSGYYDSGYVGLPLLGVGMYRFEIPKIPSLHPYGAVAMGPYVSLSTGRGIVMELSIRPGISWTFEDQLAVHGEMRFGVIGSIFFVAPTAGLTFFI